MAQYINGKYTCIFTEKVIFISAANRNRMIFLMLSAYIKRCHACIVKQLGRVSCFLVGLQVTEDMIMMNKASHCSFKSFNEVTLVSAFFFYI